MGKPITIGQSHNVVSILTNNAEWETLDGKILQSIIDNPREAGKQFTAFLKNGVKVVIGEPRIILIDRSKSFDPVAFLGKGWKIVEQDERVLALTEIDLTKVQFETGLKSGERSIGGGEKLKRLKKDGRIRLDAKIFQTLWENQHMIPESWKEKINGNTRYIFFDGTVLQDPDGCRCVFYLCLGGGWWDWGSGWLGGAWSDDGPSAVLASI